MIGFQQHYPTVLMVLFLFLETVYSPLAAGVEKEEYRVSKISPALRQDASVITRLHQVQFEIKDTRRAIERVRRVVTIFEKEERKSGELMLWYDQFREIEELEGAIYDAAGEKVRDLEDEDVKDYSSVSDYSLYEDSRIRYASLYYDRFPYTIEFTYEISYDGSLNWPEWYAQASLDPVERSRFEVLVPKDYALRFWCNRDSIHPVILNTDGKKMYVWEAKELPKLSKDIVGEDVEEVTTIVKIAASTFALKDYPGDMTSWKSFGRWFYQLTRGTNKLPKDAVQEILSLVHPSDDVREKVRKLYRYLQSRTRYVSVQLGIGGWKPFDVLYVHERRYGDCKALSNYMVSLLNEVGIEAYHVLIQHGSFRYPMIQEFPSNQFNHVIVCVPLQQDTLWLECTSQTIPFGHIGRNNENRSVLLITPEGGVVVRTPTSSSRDNMQLRRANVVLNPAGSAEATVATTWGGNQQDGVRGSLHKASPEEQERWIMNTLDVPNATLHQVRLTGVEPFTPDITLSYDVTLPQYASKTGERLFFLPNLTERRTYIPPDILARLSPLRFSYPYYDVDSVIFRIPSGFSVEAIPVNVSLESSFGSFLSKIAVVGETELLYSRTLEIRESSVPAVQYSEYRKFFSDIVKADRAQVVLVRRKQ